MALSSTENFSGGEKARLVLAMLVYQRPNLLLLDEPTNHLDLDMRYALSTALQDFSGAMVVVSHDRHLLRTVTDEFYLVNAGHVELFEGDLDDYRVWMKDVSKPADNMVNNDNTTTKIDSLNKKQQRQKSAESRKQIQTLHNQVKKLEAQIEILTSKKAEIQEQLADNSLYTAENKEVLKQIIETQSNLDGQLLSLEQQWLDVSEKIESSQT
jgi:ATP-binding cassette subfamily F protein 3